MDNLTSIHNDFYGFELTYTLIIHVYITYIQYYLVSINYVITIIFFLQFFCVNKSRCHNKEKKNDSFPHVRSTKYNLKKQDFMQKSLSNSADLTGRCSPSLHACFIKKMMKKKNKKMSTH